MRQETHVPAGSGESGFTLIEALIAIVILIFGLAAVASLMVVAGSSNTVANHSTAAAAVAAQQMEIIKAVPFDQLVTRVGGDINVDSGPTGTCGVTPVTAAPASWNCTTQVSGADPMFDVDFKGVGTMHVRWRIWPVVTSGPVRATFVQVAAESMSPAMGRRSRVVLTTYRTDNP